MELQIRKIATGVEETHHDGGPVLARPVKKGFAAAILQNPYAGTFVEDLTPFMEALKPLGLELSRRLAELLAGGDVSRIDAYGKGAIVGEGGELEHAALWHVPGGYAMREVLGGALAIVPSAKKLAGVGARIDIPIHHKDAAYVRSHFDALEVGVPDAPRADELLVVLVMASGGRPHARVGGLQASEISQRDGLR